MTERFFGTGYTTSIEGQALKIESDDGEIKAVVNLRSLSERLLAGRPGDLFDRAAAGAAISHLIGMAKAAK
jgi:hypothetical protein